MPQLWWCAADDVTAIQLQNTPELSERRFAARQAGRAFGLTRKTCGTLPDALDVHPCVAMRILRHSKSEVTLEVYTQLPDDIARDALRRLGEQLDR